MNNRITQFGHDTMGVIAKLIEDEGETIEVASQVLVDALISGHKIIVCGNGGSGANAQAFVSKLLSRYEHERPALPAIALASDSINFSALSQENRLTESFSRPFLALAQTGDVLVVLSSSGNSMNTLAAIEAAHERQCPVIAITGTPSNNVAHQLSSEHGDIHIQIPDHRAYRVHEAQLFTLHCLTALIDIALFGETDLG